MKLFRAEDPKAGRALPAPACMSAPEVDDVDASNRMLSALSIFLSLVRLAREVGDTVSSTRSKI